MVFATSAAVFEAVATAEITHATPIWATWPVYDPWALLGRCVRRFYALATQEAPAEALRRRQRDGDGGEEDGLQDEAAGAGLASRGGWGRGPWPGWRADGELGPSGQDVDRLMEEMLVTRPAPAQ